MFHHIIVEKELLPVREAAGEGKIEAMFELADAILQGRHTKASPELAGPVIEAMFDHPDFRKDLQRFCNTYVMMTHYFKLQYEMGRIELREMVEQGSEYLQMMIQTMTTAPRHHWNRAQLQHCLCWIDEHQALLVELEGAG